MSAAGLPDGLRGADYVRTFNNDKLRQDYELTIQLACAADLYVFTDDRVMAPDWVRAQLPTDRLEDRHGAMAAGTARFLHACN